MCLSQNIPYEYYETIPEVIEHIECSVSGVKRSVDDSFDENSFAPSGGTGSKSFTQIQHEFWEDQISINTGNPVGYKCMLIGNEVNGIFYPLVFEYNGGFFKKPESVDLKYSEAGIGLLKRKKSF